MQYEGLDLRSYWRIVLRWWWVLVVGVGGAVVAAYFVSGAMTPMYQATAKILVQGGQTPGVPSASEVQASQELARNYSVLITTRPIMDRVVQEMSLPYGPGALSGKIGVSSSRSIIGITVTDPDPQMAALIANTVAQLFIDDFRDQQLTQIAQFQASLSQYGIAQDPSIIAAQAATLSTLRIVDGAQAPSTPSSPRTRMNMILAAFLGLLISGVVFFVLEHLDERIDSVDDLKTVAEVMPLGAVVRHRVQGDSLPSIILDDRWHSALTESYKYISLSLEFSAINKEFKTLLVTSALPGEGKTTTSANLAISMARGGKSVILVDTDLRKPSLNRAFALENTKGLTNVLLGDATIDEVLSPTAIGSLKVVSSGPLPPDSMLVLHSDRMRDVVKALAGRADLVIFDSSPVLAVADPIVMASHVDAVLLVVDAEHGRREALKRAVQSIRQSNPNLLGAVLNKTPSRGRGGYYYYYSSYGSEDGHNGHGPSKGSAGVFAKILRRGTDREDTGVRR